MLDFVYKDVCKDIDWDELSNLYKIAPLGVKSPDHLRVVFNNSLFKVFAFYENVLIGAGRALADGADCSYLCDIAIHPDFQGYGIGGNIVKMLVEVSKDHKKIILYANPGKEGFYKRFGFKKMNTAMAIFKDEDESIKKGVIEAD